MSIKSYIHQISTMVHWIGLVQILKGSGQNTSNEAHLCHRVVGCEAQHMAERHGTAIAQLTRPGTEPQTIEDSQVTEMRPTKMRHPMLNQG